MKIKKLSSILFTAIIGVAAFGWASRDFQEPLSDLERANIEALTQIELPDVEVLCSADPNGGRCYRQGYHLKMCGEMMFFQCEYTGFQKDYCTNPC